MLSQEFLKVYIYNHNVFFGELSLNSLFYHFVRREIILLSILTEASRYVPFVGNANCTCKLLATAFESMFRCLYFDVGSNEIYFVVLGCLHQPREDTRSQNFEIQKKVLGLRLSVILYRIVRQMFIIVSEYYYTSIFRFRMSGVVSGVVIIPHLMSWQKMRGAILHTPCSFKAWYLCDRGPGSVVGIATAYGLDGPGIESRWGCEIFRTCPDRPWGPPSLLCNGYRIFPGGRVMPGRDADPTPPSSPEV